jgi:hypothetical protein
MAGAYGRPVRNFELRTEKRVHELVVFPVSYLLVVNGVVRDLVVLAKRHTNVGRPF